jgi:hypothetical protein
LAEIRLRKWSSPGSCISLCCIVLGGSGEWDDGYFWRSNKWLECFEWYLGTKET